MILRSAVLAILASTALAAPGLAKPDTPARAGGGAVVAPPIAYQRWVLPKGLTVIALPDATSANVTPLPWLSSTIRTFSLSDQRRRRPVSETDKT